MQHTSVNKSYLKNLVRPNSTNFLLKLSAQLWIDFLVAHNAYLLLL